MVSISNRLRRLLRVLGPGLITGAADDDPSGIATYSQTGAQFGYGQLWTALYTLPLLVATQEACARIGAVTGKGLVAVIKEHYSKKVVYSVCLLVLIANTISIGADLGAMAAAAQLVLPINFAVWCFIFTAVVLVLEVFTGYRVYSKILKWLVLALVAYPLTVFLVTQPWPQILFSTLVPHFEFTFTFLFIITGVLGTTISPYMFFWQASEEVEEVKDKGIKVSEGMPTLPNNFIHNLRIDTFVGMLISAIGTWCIIVVSATVLNQNGITDIRTSAEAAKALEPLVSTFPNAGYLAKLLFSLGIIGLGLLAVPVLSGSAAYALSEAFSWKEGLNLKFKRAHGFYGVITIATIIGLGINFIGIDPVKALVFSGVINGVLAAPLLYIIANIAQKESIMGNNKSGPISRFLVWSTFWAMGLTSIALFLTILF